MMAEQVFLQLFRSVDEQMNHLTTTMGAQGIAKVVPNFDGSNPKEFKDWVKNIEKFATLTGIQDEKIKLVAYQASRGPVSDYLKRYMDENPTHDWNRIKTELKSCFGDVVDSQHALLLLRKVKQKPQETIQVYAERLLALGEDAFEGQTNDAVQKQLVGYFIDGLYQDNMKLKIMRDNPHTLNAAVTVASREQNLQKRFQLRLGQTKSESAESNSPTPMEVDHTRQKGACHYCKKPGHHIKDCRKRIRQSVGVNEATTKQRKRREEINCYKCGKLGHYANECEKYNKDSLNVESSRM